MSVRKRSVPHAYWWLNGAAMAVAGLAFAADTMLPRGTTPAIGYCLVPLLTVRTGPRWFAWTMMALCTALTWVGYFLEPPGAPAWMSMFDRAMVTGVLWITFVLCRQRTTALSALARQTKSLEATTRELNRSNADLEAMASIAAHDLRNPLGTMGLFLHLLDDRCHGKIDDECDEWIASMQSEIDRMAAMIQALLNYGRAGGGGLRAQPCDGEAMLSAVLRHLHIKLESNGAEVTHSPLPVVSGDETQLTELLENLIENALKYHGDAPPRIHIDCHTDPRQWTFSVRDHGIGVNPQDAENIFLLFHRGEGLPSGSKGAGIGLATCKRIAERHGGRIWVEAADGGGSRFCFTIANRNSDGSAKLELASSATPRSPSVLAAQLPGYH